MAPQFPDPKLLPHPAAWPARGQAAAIFGWRRAGRRAAAVSLGLVALVLLAAWAIPPLLDWGRFRTAIAAIASAQLGRPVAIGGDVTLRLLPEAVLTATDVKLPPGSGSDGLSARVGSLRLQVGTWPLLMGRIVLRDLVLGTPVLTLAWPLPDSIAHPVRPHLPHAFAAHVENGVLRIGGAEITGITAAIHGGPEIASTPVLGQDPGTLAAFGAEGFAAFGGRSWRFTGALGAPDADGVSAIDLAVQGEGDAGATGGRMQGTLADGVVQGRLRAGGPDLSQLVPAARLAWTAEAPFVANGENIETSALRLTLGGLPARGEMVLRVAPPARLDARLQADRVDLDGWAAGTAVLPPPSLPMRVEVAVGQATLLGGVVRNLQANLVSDGVQYRLDPAEATFPGGAKLSVPGALLQAGPGGFGLSGPARLDAPDASAFLAWLGQLAPALHIALPAPVLQAASFSGMAQLGPGRLSVSALSGQVDGAAISGDVAIGLGARTAIAATLSIDRLSLEDWLGRLKLNPRDGAAALGQVFTGLDGTVHLKAGLVPWHGLALTDVALDASSGLAGLRIGSLSASLAGARGKLSGSVAPDGSLKDVVASLATAELAPLLPLLPPSWRWAPGFWHGPAALDLTAAGPPGALAVQTRADAGDLVMEAELNGDVPVMSGTATVTLRHPGAPRLLAELGWPGSETWLGNGSMTLLAHVRAEGDRVSLQDFALDAADLRLSGQLDADFAGTEPSLSGAIKAETLALPTLSVAFADMAALPAGWPRGWSGQLHISAAQVEAGLRPVASGLSAELALGGGAAVADPVTATLWGGRLSLQAAIDTGQHPARMALQAGLAGATIPGPVAGLPVDLAAGSLDGTLAAQATGNSASDILASVSGDGHAELRDAEFSGFDLAALARTSILRGKRRRLAIQDALSHGDSGGLSGRIDGSIAKGVIDMAPARLVSGDGDMLVQGIVDLPAGTISLGMDVRTSLPAAPAYHVQLAGPWRDARASIDPPTTPLPAVRRHAPSRPAGPAR